MNQPQPGSYESTSPLDRLRVLEQSLAYEFCVSVIEAELTSAYNTDDLPEELQVLDWFVDDSGSRTDELIPECVEYLTLRGLIERKSIGSQGYLAIRDESEAVA